ncbi:thiamine phosphate synthase [Algoriphagus sp. AGSA1]|uniref:thiamine phosphate synthase n=1 Tax=unclassified Algoriphagus TaxID=2641541 RepID=UPI0017828BD3|nr:MULTISPECIES: thiamine phosphate synthase [unclassified Algoriphagus]MCE7056280.1 thiamine phosphate synthase [Algoriphagus sp. AGSA1]
MDRNPFPYKLYLVVSEAACKKDFLHVIGQAIQGGVDIVQYREKGLNPEEYASKALQVKEITDKYNVPLIINDSVSVAKKINAFGIHVGNSDIAPTVIREIWKDCQCLGYSIEYMNQLESKETAAADYLGVSPVFSTPTKIDTITEWGIEGMKTIRKLTTKPLVAIGGLNQSNVSEVMNAGADSIAVVSAICAADDPREAAYSLKGILMNSL